MTKRGLFTNHLPTIFVQLVILNASWWKKCFEISWPLACFIPRSFKGVSVLPWAMPCLLESVAPCRTIVKIIVFLCVDIITSMLNCIVDQHSLTFTNWKLCLLITCFEYLWLAQLAVIKYIFYNISKKSSRTLVHSQT